MPRITVPIFADGDQERLSELKRAVAVAERYAAANAGGSARLGDEAPSGVETARAEYDAYLDEAAERADEWVLETIGHAEFRTLLRDHPPRKTKDDDGSEIDHPDDDIGFNTETFGKALLLFVDPEDDDIRTVVKPELDPDALRKRVKRLSEGQFETLWINAYQLNKAGVTDPKLDRFSLTTTRSSET